MGAAIEISMKNISLGIFFLEKYSSRYNDNCLYNSKSSV